MKANKRDMHHKCACIISLSVDMSRMNVWYCMVNIFDFYLSYCSLVWVQNSTFQRIVVLQEKAVRIINFLPRNSHNSFLLKQNSILKFQDKICLENTLFLSKSLNNLSPSVFDKL